MTALGPEAPLRTVTRSKTFRTVGLALILVIDILIILWMTAPSQPPVLRFFNAIKSPASAPGAGVSADDRAAQRVRGATDAGAADASAATGSQAPALAPAAPLDPDGPGALFAAIEESAAPAFTRGATPVRSTPSRGRTTGATLTAQRRRASGGARVPGVAPVGVETTPGTASSSTSSRPTLAQIIAAESTPTSPGSSAPTSSDPAVAAAPQRNDDPPRTAQEPARDPEPDPTPTEDGPAAAEPTPDDTPTVDAPIVEDTPLPDPIETAEATTEPSPTEAEPTPTATKTKRCSSPPCRR